MEIDTRHLEDERRKAEEYFDKVCHSSTEVDTMFHVKMEDYTHLGEGNGSN